MNKVLFISYYTDEYLRWARILEMSFIYHGLDYKLYYRPTTGSWHNNVARKPKIIAEAIAENKSYDYVCWIDADSMVIERPQLLFGVECDIAFPVFSPLKRAMREPMAGVVLLKTNDMTIRFMEDVAARIVTNGTSIRLDQKAMSGSLVEFPEMKIVVLPRSYVDLNENLEDIRPIIVSRRLARFGLYSPEVHQIAIDEDRRRSDGTFVVARRSVSNLLEKMIEAGTRTTI